MIDSGQLRQPTIGGHWRRSVGVAVVLAAVALVGVVDKHEVSRVWRTLHHARPVWCVASGLLATLWMANTVALQRAALLGTGVRMRRGNIAAATAIAHALNLTTKSGGLAGLVAFRSEARRSGLPESSVTAGYLFAAMLTEWAFLVPVVGSFAVLTADGHLTIPDLMALCVFFVYLATRCCVLLAATKDRERLRRLLRFPRGALSRLRRRRLEPATTRTDETADTLFDSLRVVRERPRALGPAAAHALITELLAIALLWSCLQAVGAPIDLLHALVVYSVTGVFGIVGFLPGGLGFVEVSMSAVLIGFGLPSVAAASGVVFYRVFELWLPIALGSSLAHRLRFDRP